MWAIHLLKNEALHNRSSPPGEALQTSSTAPPANCPSKRRGDGVTYILPNDRQDVWIILRYVPMTTPPEKNTFWHLWRPFLGRHRATNFQRAGRGEGGAGSTEPGPAGPQDVLQRTVIVGGKQVPYGGAAGGLVCKMVQTPAHIGEAKQGCPEECGRWERSGLQRHSSLGIS